MLRLLYQGRRFCLQKSTNSTIKGASASESLMEKANAEVDLANTVKLTPIGRYVPTDPSAFLVEGHRLTGSENIVQGISSVLPWIALLFLGVSPFLFMQYNLEKMKSKSTHDEISKPLPVVRGEFRQIEFSDMPEILERRTPTLIVIYSDNYHSMVYLPMLRDLSEYHSICVLPATSCSKDFISNYKSLPHAHLVLPGNRLIEFEGPWDRLPEFILVNHMGDESRQEEFENCVFKRRFVLKNWTISDSVNSSSLDDALVRCLS